MVALRITVPGIGGLARLQSGSEEVIPVGVWVILPLPLVELTNGDEKVVEGVEAEPAEAGVINVASSLLVILQGGRPLGVASLRPSCLKSPMLKMS